MIAYQTFNSLSCRVERAGGHLASTNDQQICKGSYRTEGSLDTDRIEWHRAVSWMQKYSIAGS